MCESCYVFNEIYIWALQEWYILSLNYPFIKMNYHVHFLLTYQVKKQFDQAMLLKYFMEEKSLFILPLIFLENIHLYK